MVHPLVTAASELAETTLFPSALEVDSMILVPSSHLESVADAGLYGIETADLDASERWLIGEILASGCLATAFVWIQHHGAVRSLLGDVNPVLQAKWLEAFTTGATRAGIAIGGVRHPHPSLTARRVEGGWSLDGSVPWVTGWGLIDVMLTGAVVDGDSEVWGFVPAVAEVGLTPDRYRLVAADASSTVALTFEGLFLPDGMVLGVERRRPPPANDGGGRGNGGLALGVVRRACALMGPSPVDAELAAARSQLDTAGDDEMGRARAAASELALRATARLVVHTGSRAIDVGDHAQMLARGALFTAVFGTRASVRESLLGLLDRTPTSPGPTGS